MSYSSPTLAWLWGLQARWGGAHTSSPPPCATALALFGRSPDLCPGVLRSLVREARGGVHLRIPPPPPLGGVTRTATDRFSRICTSFPLVRTCNPNPNPAVG